MDITKLTASFDTDPEKELKGVEVHIGEGFFIRVARARNENAAKLFRELSNTPQADMARIAGSIDPKIAEQIVVEVYARCILTGWRGLTENGVEIPYSVAKAKEFVSMPDFRKLIEELSERQDLYRRNAVNGAVAALGES